MTKLELISYNTIVHTSDFLFILFLDKIIGKLIHVCAYIYIYIYIYMGEIVGFSSIGKTTSLGEGKTLNSKPKEYYSGESVRHW